MMRHLVIRYWLLWLFCAGCAAAEGDAAQYFRSDFGVVHSDRLPDHLDARQMAWRKPLDSGHSTPVIAHGRIFLTSYRAATHELATLALDERSGEELWRQTITVPRIEAFHPQTGNAAMATPACDGQRLYSFFGSYGLICYDLDGKKVWEHPFGPFQDEYGAASSPVLAGDKIILNEDHDIDSFLIALDRYTGRTLWKTPRPEAVRSYSTPVLWREGKEALVAGALELAGYDLQTGRKLWWVNGLARIVIPMPVPAGEMIYMASWAPGADSGQRVGMIPFAQALARWDRNKDGKLAKNEIEDREVLDRFFRMDLDQNGSLDEQEWDRHARVFRLAQNALLALKPAGRGDLTRTALQWKYQRGIPYVATPLLDKGILWMVKDGGLVTKINATTGQWLQTERLPGLGNYFASPVLGDGKIYFASERGVVSVVADQPEWKIISARDFGERIYATPKIRGGKVFIRTERAIYCFRASD